MSRRAWFQVHGFTGSITGLMLFVICWSGSFAVISNEIDWLVTPEARVAARDVGRIQPRSWGEIVAVAAAAYPDASIRSARAPLYSVSAAEVLVTLPGRKRLRVHVDPHTGDVRPAVGYFNVQRFFRGFHRKLFAPGVGRYIVPVFALVLLTSAVSALWTFKRWWRGFSRLPRGSGRLFWGGLHKLVGLWSLGFMMIIGVTGGWYLYEMGQRDLFGGPVSYIGDVVKAPKARSDATRASLPLDELLAGAHATWPGFAVRRIRFRYAKGALDTVRLEGRDGVSLLRDRANQMHLDARSGALLSRSAAEDLPVYWRWSHLADPLHFGYFGGPWSKLAWFGFGIALCGLILTGTWLHANRLAGQGRPVVGRAASVAAALVTMAGVLGVSLPFGIAEIRESGAGLPGIPTMPPGAAVAILAWIGATLAIIAVWTALLCRPWFR